MKFYHPINVTLEQTTALKLKTLSDRLGISMNQIARRLIDYAIDKPEALQGEER